MKKLMITLAAGLVSALTMAAQCAGTTLEGARCKREAAGCDILFTRSPPTGPSRGRESIFENIRC